MVSYTLRVRTSDLRGAGSDAAVEVELLGEAGRSGWQRLLANSDAFARNKVGC
jgi:hypothetical protein